MDATARKRPAPRQPAMAPAGAANTNDDAQQEDEAQQDLDQNVCTASLIENVKREVGLAIWNPLTLELHLQQFIEQGRSYSTTSLLLHARGVRDAVVVASADKHRAFAAAGVGMTVQGMPIHALPRRAFDDTAGMEALLSVCDKESEAALSHAQVHSSHYLALGAAGALLQYLASPESGGMAIAGGSVRVRLEGTRHHMQLDAGSVEALELVRPSSRPHSLLPSAPPAASGGVPFRAKDKGAGRQPQSLLEVLQRTRTAAGSRLLRASLLQPLTDIPTLEARYNCLQELLDDDNMAFDVAQCLCKLPKDLDKMCSMLALRPAKAAGGGGDPSRRIGASITAAILLRGVLQGLEGVTTALQNAQSPLLQAVASTCKLSEFDDMLTVLEEVLESEAHASKSAFMNRIQQCFAIKPTSSPLLELARNSFCRTTELIQELAAQYQHQHALNVKSFYSAKRGFYLSVSSGKGEGAGTTSALPPVFIVLDRRQRGVCWCTTHELNALNTRLKDAASSCLTLTEEVLDGLIAAVSSQMPLLQRLIDNLALLDMMLALAEAVADAPAQCCRPQLNADGPLAIVQGRHPVLERCVQYRGGTPFQPNDTFISEQCCLHIIAGPTMAGKSTYLKQVALLVVLAQIGCFVPAEFMSLPLFELLFTRMVTGDSIETNSSSFMVEMQEVAHILAHVTPRSLVLMDELGRATSTADGVALAWAVCERLADARCATLLATHFRQLAGLTLLHPSIKIWELQVTVTDDALDYQRTLKPGGGVPDADAIASHYGLAAARSLGMPATVLRDAERVARLLEERDRSSTLVTSHAAAAMAGVYSLAGRLKALAGQYPEAVAGEEGADWASLRPLLEELQQTALQHAGMLARGDGDEDEQQEHAQRQ